MRMIFAPVLLMKGSGHEDEYLFNGLIYFEQLMDCCIPVPTTN